VVKQIQVEIFSKQKPYEVEPFTSGLMWASYTYTLKKPMDPALFDRPGIYTDVKYELFQ
jgi:hypothetical protein